MPYSRLYRRVYRYLRPPPGHQSCKTQSTIPSYQAEHWPCFTMSVYCAIHQNKQMHIDVHTNRPAPGYTVIKCLTWNSKVSSNSGSSWFWAAVRVRCSAQSAGTPCSSRTTYGSMTSPFAPDPRGLGRLWALMTCTVEHKAEFITWSKQLWNCQM